VLAASKITVMLMVACLVTAMQLAHFLGVLIDLLSWGGTVTTCSNIQDSVSVQIRA